MNKSEIIRWGAIDYEYYTCFDNLTPDEFIEANSKSPALGFSDTYEWLLNAPIEEIKNSYGEELIETFIYPVDEVEKVKTKVEETLLKNKNAVDLERMFRPN